MDVTQSVPYRALRAPLFRDMYLTYPPSLYDEVWDRVGRE